MNSHHKALLISITIFLMIQWTNINLSSASHEHQPSLDPEQLTPHSYLEITSEEELLSTVSAEGWTGQGTLEDPFVIENYKFEGDMADPSIVENIKSQENYVKDDFHRFSLVISNIESHILIHRNQFSFSLLINNTDQDNYPTIEISGNEWVTENHPNNLFLIGDKYLVNDNVFYGNTPSCAGVELNYSSKVYHRGKFALFEINHFIEDTGCFPTQHLVLDVPIGAGTLGPGDVGVSNNLFEPSIILVNTWNPNVDFVENEFHTRKIAILVHESQTLEIDDNNFYIEEDKADSDVRFVSGVFELSEEMPFVNRLSIDTSRNHYENWISPDEDEDGIVDVPYVHNVGSDEIVLIDTTPKVNNISTHFNSVEPPLDNTIESPDPSPLSSWETYAISTILLVSVSYISYAYAYPTYVTQKKIYEGTLTPNTKAIIKDLFNSQSVLYYTLIGQNKVNDKEVEEELKNAIPKKIYDFKYLLHPVRMAMLKLLYENLELTSIEMKDVMGVSWNDYTTHSLSLKKNGYIRIQDGFIDGKKRQLLTIETKGTEEFKALLDMMHLFMDNSSSLSTYIKAAQERLETGDQDLYPSS